MNTKARALLPLLSLLAACGGTGGEAPAEGAGDSTAGTTGETTGETGEEFCGLSDEDPDAPWFELYEGAAAIEAGDDLHLVCGPQGSFMFQLTPVIGGLIPEGDYVPLRAELDVEGFNVLSSGHFAVTNSDIFVACCPYQDYDPYACSYETYTLIMFPPDQITDKSVLHGATGTLRVTMTTSGDPVEEVIDVELWAIDDGSWEFCEYY